ncbi:MAG: ParB N-terminal domain-containing protein [Lachnospiraceae bacterium]|nr:ParB N-terminal domain-containing protein [Lachnospiraceae bacterium]
MGSLSKLIKEKGGEFGGVKTGQIRVQQIHYTKLKESSLNFYTRSEDEVEELADTMLIAGGILQPLIVRKTDMSEYEILAGHKRKRASVYNVNRGYKEYEFLPCIVIDMGGLMAKKISEKILAENGEVEDDKLLDMIAEYIVICTNSTTSESSDYEKMMQAVRLSKILPVMLDNEDLKGRALRAEIAKEMKYGDGQIGRYLSIYNNLIPEAMERFKDRKINFSAACSLSGLDRNQQQEILKRQQITAADIEALKQDKNKEAVSNLDTEKVVSTESLGQKGDAETVSNLDTDNMEPTAAESITDDGYERTEGTKEGMYHAFQLVFDDEKSGFPQEVKEELLSHMEKLGGHVSVLTDIFDKALPFENDHIKIENICGYTIYFKDTHKKIRTALWPFWDAFISKYHYHEELPSSPSSTAEGEDFKQAVEDGEEKRLAAAVGKENKETAASERTETVQPYSIGYTPEEVRQIYDEQVERIRHIETIRKSGDLTKGDKQQYKKAKIIRDGMTYILEAFKEGTIC